MAEKLTPQQLEAVTNRGGKLLVSAAAGSGKTKVLVDRLMSYLNDPIAPCNIDDFLIITYTKAAASELRGKIASKLSEKIAENPENRHLQRQLQRLYMTNISTVHSFCGDILRQFAYRLDLSADFRVADENECVILQETAMEQILEEAYSSAETDPEFCAFVDTQGNGRDDRKIPEVLLLVYHSAQCHLDPEGWLDRCIDNSDADGCTDASETVWGRYLMDDFFSYLDMQISAMEHCAKIADETEQLEKVAQLLWDSVHQLCQLRESETWDDVVRRRKIEYGTLRFPKKFPDAQLEEDIKAVRNACKTGLEKRLRTFTDTSDSILSDLRLSSATVRGMIKLVRRFKSVYDELKRRKRVLDFSDLEHFTLDLLLGKRRTGPTSIALEIGRRFREVMVDEYQDSNEVQDAIYSALTQERSNCFMVGDVKQSIYQFRLADPGIFLEKYASYPPAEEAVEGQGRKVVLSKNFRSAGAVLDAVNSVFETCMSPAVGGLYYGDEEALHEGIPHEPLNEPEIEFCAVEISEDTYEEEPFYVAQRIEELLDGTHYIRSGDGLRSIQPDDIVILLRSPGSVGEDFQRALEARGIRCSFGGGGDLLNEPEIVVLRSLLQTIYNPQLDIPLVATMISPLFCYTADDLAALRAVHRSRSIYQSLLTDTSEKTNAFLRQLALFRDEARTKTLTQLLETVFVETGIDSIYSAMENGQLRRDNLQTFFQLAVQFENGGQRDLGRFLDYLDSVEKKGLLTANEPSSSGCVTIMSIHKSKGLEFPVVFLSALGRGFNMQSQRAQVLCDKELGVGVLAVDETRRIRYPTLAKKAIATKIARDSLSEELRVLYVAMTRARDRMIMTYSSESLEKELSATVSRMNMGSTELMIHEASSPGRWVLMSSLKRTEAGELFHLGGQVLDPRVSEFPWRIKVVQVDVQHSNAVGSNMDETSLNPEILAQIRKGMETQYSHIPATQTPSKQTATQRKGRLKDQEAAENAQEPRLVHRTWRKPSFVEQTVDAASYGTAIHAILQHMDFRSGFDEGAIACEVARLQRNGILSQEQAQLVDIAKLSRFFSSELGTQVATGENILREFKFSILDDGSAYSSELQGEKILLQGVVDCAIMEDDGITVIDFKTDRIKEDKLEQMIEHYRPQVQAYADSLSRIFQKPVKKACLYFFELNEFVDVL